MALWYYGKSFNRGRKAERDKNGFNDGHPVNFSLSYLHMSISALIWLSFKRTYKFRKDRKKISWLVGHFCVIVLITSWSLAGLWLTWERLSLARSGSGTEWRSSSHWSGGSSGRSSAPGSRRTRYVPTPGEPAQKKGWLAIDLLWNH